MFGGSNNRITFAINLNMNMKKYYPLLRSLHLYVGLFISPLILIFAFSVLVFDHQQLMNQVRPVRNLPDRSVRLDSIPVRSTDILTARAILEKVNVIGEIDYLNKNDSTMSFPVKTPEIVSKVNVNFTTKTVNVSQADQGILRGTAYLHSMPGPHNANIRGNSGYIKIWRYFVDTTVYSLIFLTLTGFLIWLLLQSERKLGIFSLVAGLLIFTILLILTF
jgi:hypothetical protein